MEEFKFRYNSLCTKIDELSEITNLIRFLSLIQKHSLLKHASFDSYDLNLMYK